MLIMVAYTFALAVSVHDEELHQDSPQYLRNVGFAFWAQVYTQMCTQTFAWIAMQEHHHDEDAKQISLLLRYTLLKCVTSVIFIITFPREETLSTRSVATIKTFLYSDAIMGPMFRYVDPFNLIKRFLARWLPNQPLMDWAHLSPMHDIADSYSNTIKTIFLGLFVVVVVPSSPIVMAVSCLTSYWVDKHSLCRMWSWNSHSKPAKWTAEAVQNLLAVVLVGTLMQNLQLLHDWPFDNLCEVPGVFVDSSDVWRNASANTDQVFGFCEAQSNTVLGRRSKFGMKLFVEPQPGLTEGHAQAITIYSVGSVLITVLLVVYFWGRTALDMAYHFFYTHEVVARKDEASLPSFSDNPSRLSAYIPQVKDPSYMFPLLQTDTDLMDSRHIPWNCNYDNTNLTQTLGDENIAKGLHHSFSVVKRYRDDQPGSPLPVAVQDLEAVPTPKDGLSVVSVSGSGDFTASSKPRRATAGSASVSPLG